MRRLHCVGSSLLILMVCVGITAPRAEAQDNEVVYRLSQAQGHLDQLVHEIADAAATIVVDVDGRVAGNLLIPDHVRLRFLPGRVIRIPRPAHVAMYAEIDAGRQHIFVLNGRLSFLGTRNDAILPQWFGARGDGDATPDRRHEETAAFRMAVRAAINSDIPLTLLGSKYTYALNTVTVHEPIDRLAIDGAGATILAHAQPTLQFGPNVRHIDGHALHPMSNITIENVRFTQQKPHRAGLYLFLLGVTHSSIRSNRFEYVGNGGVLILNGCRHLVIEDNAFEGAASVGTRRAIWISGTRTRHYRGQCVDVAAIDRSQEPLPPEAGLPPTQILVRRNTIRDLDGYGIYLMNARHVWLVNNDIEITSGARCITINTYSPFTRVLGGACRARRDATGILVTQVSTDVLIDGVRFLGSFGAARCIQVQFLAQAEIRNCIFAARSGIDVQVNMGGRARIINNDFLKPPLEEGWHVYVSTLDPLLYGHRTSYADYTEMGTRARAVPGVEIIGNRFKNRRMSVCLEQQAAANGRIARMDKSLIEGNVFYDRDDRALRGQDRIVTVRNALRNGQPVAPINYRFVKNRVLQGGEAREVIHDPFEAFNKPVIGHDATNASVPDH